MHRRALAILIVLAACNEPSSLAERAAAVERPAMPEPGAPVEPPAVPLSHARLPSSTATPSGIPADLWHDVHWLPPTVLGLTRFEHGHAPMVQWLEQNVPAEASACAGVLAGVRRLIAVEVPRELPQQVQIFRV